MLGPKIYSSLKGWGQVSGGWLARARVLNMLPHTVSSQTSHGLQELFFDTLIQLKVKVRS